MKNVQCGRFTNFPCTHVEWFNEIRIEARVLQELIGLSISQQRRRQSHLTYNEYPLEVTKLEIDDELGIRNREDWGTIRGNAEHSWELLH